MWYKLIVHNVCGDEYYRHVASAYTRSLAVPSVCRACQDSSLRCCAIFQFQKCAGVSVLIFLGMSIFISPLCPLGYQNIYFCLNQNLVFCNTMGTEMGVYPLPS